ncbi:30S ribosomal protein S2 [Candidatus Peregrinibacteria bacterium CG_4_10_14_0_2_um_filter_38_24]|nr:MAG: 30S ribosomal protein S2 [Candidatus Peregrinibacteria bacterium CG_4_10_14_0_2_um_filter_38_24]PJC39332.1 MAG: 30S ribosomal protein S2 [Candidatus Peregrinibacteria bacterium CG_4_9_14_0_2_um_filter_38_9]
MDKKLAQEMFDNAVHVGHRTQKWNPRMKKYLYGEKDGVHIINLEKTSEGLDRALAFLEKLVSEGKNVLFVSTKPQSLKLVEEAAKSCGMPYVVSRWIPGLITNFSTLKNRIKYFVNLKAEMASGEFDKYTKKEAAKLKKIIDTLELSLGGVQNLRGVPDAVFVVDTVRDKIAVKEAKVVGIPIVAITDSNSDPTVIGYPIPGNDDALKSLTYLVGKIVASLNKARKAQ